MIRLQNAELLSMLARGTAGGLLRADGSESEPGVHLRWQTAPDLGFPSGGFDVYRRPENYRRFLRCGTFWGNDLGGVVWVSSGDDVDRPVLAVIASGEARVVKGCGEQNRTAAAFPGAQEVRLVFREPARVVRITFDERTAPDPVAEAYWRSGSGDVLLGRERVRMQGDKQSVTLFADQIDYVLLTGEDMVICEVCCVLVRDGFSLDWPQIPLNGGTPIYLPITHPE